MRHLAFCAAVALITFLLGISLAGQRSSTTFHHAPCGRFVRSELRAEVQTPPPARLTPLTALAPDGPNPVAEQEIRELYRQYALAQTRRDAGFFRRTEADEFILTYATGRTLTREQAIALMKTWDDDTAYSNEVLDIKFYGNSAIVKGQMSAARPGGSGDQWKWLDVLARREGRWQILSTTQVNY